MIHTLTSSPPRPAELAQLVLTGYWHGALPVDPAGIARQLGAKVIERHVDGDGGWEPGLSGYFSFEGSIPTIEYSGLDADVRQRFTIAHELGHFLLGHRDVPRDAPGSFGARQTDSREVAANRFAAELLMPAQAVRTVFGSGLVTSLDELAKSFRVSKPAMAYRLRNLGLIRG